MERRGLSDNLGAAAMRANDVIMELIAFPFLDEAAPMAFKALDLGLPFFDEFTVLAIFFHVTPGF